MSLSLFSWPVWVMLNSSVPDQVPMESNHLLDDYSNPRSRERVLSYDVIHVNIYGSRVEWDTDALDTMFGRYFRCCMQIGH